MADYTDQVNALFPGLDTTPVDRKKDRASIGWEGFETDLGVSSLGSFFAGIGSGFFKIPEGFVSLGANLIDLGADTNTAEDVEKFFAKINPFDEYAEATAAGKISEVLTNLALPVGYAAKAAGALTKGALAAKKSGKYFKVLDDDGVPILEAVRKGQKANDPMRLAQLNTKGKLTEFGAAALAGGAAESIFVADPEEVGTFGDLFGGGPTQMERGKDYEPERELLNRLKLGIEGVGFTGALGAAGSGIKQLADSTKAGRVAQGKIGRALDWVSQRFRPRSGKNPQYFTTEMGYKGKLDADLIGAENLARKYESQIDSLVPTFDKYIYSRTDATAAKDAIAKQANKALLSNINENTVKFGSIDAISPTTGEIMKSPGDIKRLTDKYIKEGLSETKARAKAIKNAKAQQVLKVILPQMDPAEVKALDKMLVETGKKFGKDAKKLSLLDVERMPFKPGTKVVIDSKGNTATVFGFNKKNIQLGNTTDNYILKGKGTRKNWTLDRKTIDRLNPPKSRISKTERTSVVTTLNEFRDDMGRLLAIEGRSLDTLTPQGGKSILDRWKKIMPQVLTDRLDVGYKVFKNNPIKLADNYAPTKEVIEQETKNLQKIAANLPTPVKLTNTEARQLVDKIWRTAFLDKGFDLSKKGSVLFQMGPYQKNFIKESFADKAANYSKVQLKQLTDETQASINRLLGKDESVMSTMINGTNMLSTVIRRDAHYADQLINSNNIKVARTTKINELMKQGMSAEEAAAKAPIQTYFDTETELIKATGARPGDYRQIGSITGRGQEGIEEFNPLTDRAKVRTRLKGDIDPKTGRPLWEESVQRMQRTPSTADLLQDYQAGIGKQGNESFEQFVKRNKEKTWVEIANINPLTGKWTLKGNADAIYNVNKNLITPDSGWAGRLYANSILYPKATSQMAKTILAPFTHMRNFLSAGAFATANGIIPFIGPGEGAARKALRALQLGPRTREGNQIYQELLERGVVNSQVQLSELKALLKDVDFGSYLGSKKAFEKLAKGMSRIKRFAQDAYTAEDDFWKIYSYFKEQDRLFAAYKNAGIAEGSNFTNMAGKIVKLNPESMKDEAAAIVRNNIPNYAYVSDFVRGLRQYPLGNFVAFPSEILRTGTNIVQRGLDEIFYTVRLPNGDLVRPLKSIGLQRLIGMTVTTSAVPYAAVAGGKALYDISQDELEAIRRYVPKWSKNSTLIPLKGEDGTFKYIDFSHMNAYDTLTRPIQTLVNRVQAGEDDKDGLLDDFMMGVFESTKEMALPFISESIWTEALADLYMRGGETRDGFRVYNEEDNIGNQLYNSLAHLTKAQLPLNWKQWERLGLSLKPINDKGRFDERGREYEFGNELAGIIGARAIEVEPEKSIKYKIADYSRGTRNAKALFTREVLKGGVIEPAEIYDAYINANRALYAIQKNMADDIRAAQILGMTDDEAEENVGGRIGAINYEMLSENLFRPMKITESSMIAFEDIASTLGISNPLEAVIDTIEELRESLGEYSLSNEGLPDIKNPFSTPILPQVINSLPLPQLNTQTQGIPGSQFGTVPSNTTLPFENLPINEKYKTVFPQG